MTSDPSNYHREYSPYGSYSLFQFEGSDVISVLKNSIEYSFVFFKCLFEPPSYGKTYLIETPCFETKCYPKFISNLFFETQMQGVQPGEGT